MSIHKKFKEGGLYYIRFYDHVMHGKVGELMEVEVCGWVRKSTKTTLSISTWNTITSDYETKEENDFIYNLAKKIIIESKYIKLPI